MSAIALIMIMVGVIFAGDAVKRWWRRNAWRWRRSDHDDDDLAVR